MNSLLICSVAWLSVRSIASRAYRISSISSNYFARRSISGIPKYIGLKLMSTESGESADGGHAVTVPEISTDDKIVIETLQQHQRSAPKLSVAEEIRTLIENSIGYGVISTNSVQYEGYPTGSVVGFSLDQSGKPFFVFSTLSAHTTDILSNSKASLTVTSSEFKGAADGRITLIGDISRVAGDEIAQLRENYLKRHKDAFWIDFG